MQLSKYTDFDTNKIGTTEVFHEYDRIRDYIYDLYWNKKKSCEDISKILGINYKHCISQTLFRILDIDSRSISEANYIAHETGKISPPKNTKYKDGKHTTWDGRTVYLRSSYELEYAKYLDDERIEYYVENMRIRYFDTNKNRYRTYVPDFYIPSENKIVEIKSSWTIDYKNIIDKIYGCKEVGYGFELILDHKKIDLTELRKMFENCQVL